MNCPVCGKEVEYLLCYTTEYNSYYYDGKVFQPKDYYVEEMEFSCPSCGTVVAEDEEKARNLFSQPTASTLRGP